MTTTNVRKARFFGLFGTWKTSEELREKWLFYLLSDRPRVRIAPGSPPKPLDKLCKCLSGAFLYAAKIFLDSLQGCKERCWVVFGRNVEFYTIEIGALIPIFSVRSWRDFSYCSLLIAFRSRKSFNVFTCFK